MGSLTTVKDYLGIDDAITLTGSFETTAINFDSKIEPKNATFTCDVPFFKEVFTGVTLTKGFFQISLDKTATGWDMKPTVKGEFDVDSLTDKDPGKLNFVLSWADSKLTLEATATNLKGAFGIDNLTLDNLDITGVLGAEKSLTLTSKLMAGKSTYDFNGIITEKAVGLVAKASDFDINDLGELFNNISPAGLKIPEFDVDFKDSTVALASNDCTVGSDKLEKGLTLISSIDVYGYTVKATALLSLTGVKFNGSLGDVNIGPVDVKQTDIDFQIWRKTVNKPAKFSLSGSAVIEGLTLNCGVFFEKNTTTTTVLYANIEADTFSLSNVFPPAKDSFVDELKFSKVGFVYASADCTTQNNNDNYSVSQGLSLMGTLEEIPGLSDLTGEKHIGLVFTAHYGTTTDISVAIPTTSLDLGSSVTCDPFKIKINITPTPELMLVFGMNVAIPNQNTPLHFDMALALGAVEANASVTMKNYWKNPFGIDGLKIGPALALQLGIIYEQFVATGIPSEFGIAGGLAIGDTVVDMAVKISENPTEEILSGKLEELKPTELINFATQLIDLDVPDVPNFFEFKELSLYCAPTGGSIGTITYKPGFSFAGDLVIAGKEISMYTRISDTAIEGAGHIDAIDFGPLSIRGLKGKDAVVDLELSTSKQSLLIDGAFTFLGIEEGVYVNVSNKGIAFKFEQNFLDALSYEIQGESSGSITDPTSLDFKLSGEMDNNITDLLKNEVAGKIHSALNETEDSIDDAEKKVADAKAAYEAEFDKANKTLTDAQAAANAELTKLTNELNSAKSDYASKLDSATNAVKSAKQTYDNALQSAQDAVDSAQKTYNNGIRDAQNAVNSAQATYNNGINSAQNAVNSAQRSYNNAFQSAKNAVDSASRKCDSLDHWYSKPAYWAAKGVLEAAKLALSAVQHGSEYAAFESAKAALSVAKTGANYTAFMAAKGALTVAKTGANYTAFMGAKATLSAVQHGADYTAWQGAITALNGVKAAGEAAVSAAQSALNNIGKSAAYVALEAAKAGLTAVEKGSAAVAFDSAKGALEAAKLGAGAVLKLAEYIAKHSGDLIDIKSMKFSGSLKAVEKGDLLDAELDLSLLGHEYNWTIDFNVKDVASFVESLFNKAFDELKSIVS